MPDAFTIDPSGKLFWTGASPPPYLTPDQQAPLYASGGGPAPAGALWGMYAPTPGAAPIPIPGFSMPTPASAMPSSASGGSSSGLVPYKAGPITQTVNDLLTAAISGGSKGGPAGQTLFSLAGGNIPPAIQAAFDQNLKRQNATITESMGAVGNRFGTDLATTLADAAGRANVNFGALGMSQALDAIRMIIGLGTGQANLEFTGDQAALTRAHEDFLAASQGDLLSSILPFLLGGG